MPKVKRKLPKKINKIHSGKSAKAGATKSILDVVKGNKISKAPAPGVPTGGGGRAARTRGGVNPFSRANSSASSLSH